MGGRSLDAKIKDALDNFVSRCVGFVVRFTVLLAALFGMLISFLFGVVTMLLWPLIPLLVVYCVVRGITG